MNSRTDYLLCNSCMNMDRERRVTMKQLVDELKTKKFIQDWEHLEPPLATISRDQCERIIINLMIL